MPRKIYKRLFPGVSGPRNIDPEIKDLVIALNSRGYRTRNSCAGNEYTTAVISFIDFRPPLTVDERSEIKDIVGQFTDVPFHWFQNSIIFRTPIGLEDWAKEKYGKPGWLLELEDHTEDPETLEEWKQEGEKEDFWK